MGRDFSDWLTKERKARNISIRQLSGKIPFSHSHIAKIERGEAIITWDFCVAVAKAFNQPVWNLFILAGLLDLVPDEIYKDEKVKVLLNSFNQLPNEGKDELLRYAAWLVHQYTNKI
jgi:transcriptional regulator with XRE-family HTH domain